MFSEESCYPTKAIPSQPPIRVRNMPREKLYDLADKCVRKLESDITELKEVYVEMRVRKLTNRWLFKLTTEAAKVKATKEFETLKLLYVIGYHDWQILILAKSWLERVSVLDWETFEVPQADINGMSIALSSAAPYESYLRRRIQAG